MGPIMNLAALTVKIKL